MKTSLICTVLNEEESIQALLDSIKVQTKKPDEVIIVDAGSTDRTTNIIKKNKQIRLVTRKGFNRSKGRNEAVKIAKHQLIAVTDAGCTLNENWLKNITKPFKNLKVDAVAGYYHIRVDSVFQKSIAPFVAIMPEDLDINTYLPSSRSLAFRKKAFTKFGKYSENLNYCEDLVFAKNLKNKSNLVVKTDAIIYWQMVTNLKDYFSQIKNYASGDIKAKYKPHLVKILSVFIRYLFFIIFPSTFILYLFWPIIKHFHFVKHPLAFIYLPIIQLTTDLAIVVASIQSAKIPL